MEENNNTIYVRKEKLSAVDVPNEVSSNLDLKFHISLLGEKKKDWILLGFQDSKINS